MILVCGEALVDLFVDLTAGDPRAAMPARATPGGSPMNVAIGLRRLGVACGFFGALSSDGFGHRLAALLTREGVALDLAPRLTRPTTLSLVALDESGVPTYRFCGDGAADVALDDAHLPARLPDAVAALAFGSYTLAVDPAGATYLALARREKERRLVSVDANLRPTVTPDRVAWRARFHAFVACADVVKASDEDIALGYGPDAQIDRVVADWRARGARLVVVTRGAQGSSAYARQGRRVDAPALPVAPVDTVGAGDAVHAALLARLAATDALSKPGLDALSDASLRDLLAYANAAAALVCARPGADMPDAAEVARAMRGDAFRT